MQEVMRETAGWSELVFSPGLTAIIQFGWDTTLMCPGGKITTILRIRSLFSGTASEDGKTYLRSSGDTIPNCLTNSVKSGRERALRLMAMRQARLEPLALSVSGRERMFNNDRERG